MLQVVGSRVRGVSVLLDSATNHYNVYFLDNQDVGSRGRGVCVL